MKILVGVTTLKEVKYFLSHGASEVYFGFSRIDNHRQSRLCFSEAAQIYEAIDAAHGFGKKIFLAVNEAYLPDQFPSIDRYLEGMLRRGLDGVIIKDIFLLSHLNRIGLKTKFVLSSLAQCFNSHALQFYRQYQIARIVIPQHMLAREARDLVFNKFNIETECFLLPDCFCRNIDGLCNFHALTRLTGSLPCEMGFKREDEDASMFKPSEALRMGILYDLFKMGVPYLKLSRWNPKKTIVTFQQVLDLVALLGQKGISRPQFITKAFQIRDRG
jgi:putative protease